MPFHQTMSFMKKPYYYVTFGVSGVASLLAIAIKLQLVVFKLRKRNRAGKGKVEASAAALLRMGDEFDELELQIKEAVGAFLLSMFEVRRNHLDPHGP
jgi:hypothetical protein